MTRFNLKWLVLGLCFVCMVIAGLVYVVLDDSPALSILSCGATANDSSDDYQAIAHCITKAKKQGKSLYVPPGEFRISDILVLDGVSMNGAGKEGSILISTNPERGSIDIKGKNVKLSKLKHIYDTVVPRGNGADEKNSITVRGATHFTIEHVHIDEASTAGIMVRSDSSKGTIMNNIVENTNADGIHITDGSNEILIEDNLVRAVGDDTIAVVSYIRNGSVANHITIKNNDVGYNSQARGISVVGGADVLIEGNSIKETQMAGLYISVEKEWDTNNTERITVNNNTIDHTGIREPNNHPNVLVYASQGILNEVTFSNNIIKNAAHSGIGVWGEGSIGQIYFNSNTLTNSRDAATVFKKGSIKFKDNIGF